jgi:hypothetical protein
VLINLESSIGAFLLTALLYFTLLLPFAYHLFLHLLSTNYKCIQPCYFPLLLKPTAQKEKMGWLRRGVLGCVLRRLPFLWSYGVFRCSVALDSHLSLYRHYLCNKYILFMTFDCLWTLLVHMCETICPEAYIWWVLGFGIKIRYDRTGTRAVSTVGTLT